MKVHHIDIPRTASSSVRKALGIQESPMHVTAEIKRERHDDWEEAFTFRVIRNPFTRLVSQFTHRKAFHGLSLTAEDFERWLYVRYVQQDRDCGPDEPYTHRLWWPQHKYVTDGEEIIVDWLFRFERLDTAWGHICTRLDIDRELPHTNPSGVDKDWREFYTEVAAEIVRVVFRKDFGLSRYDRSARPEK